MQNYSVSVAWSPEDEAFVATSGEFPHLSGLGETASEAVEALADAMRTALAAWAEQGRPAPEPVYLPAFSGQLRLRLPKSVHSAAVARAAIEDVSLNALLQAYIVAGLTGDALGSRATQRLESAVAQCEAVVREATAMWAALSATTYSAPDPQSAFGTFGYPSAPSDTPTLPH